MAGSSKRNQTILFADIAGSTRLYETLGDEHASTLVTYCLEKLDALIQQNRGTMVKTIGDEAMVRFNAPHHAATAAICVQEAFSADTRISSIPIQLRIGLHHGPVIFEKQDVFGDAVNIAARMVDQAKAGQIITSGETLKLIENTYRSAARLVDQTRVKGKWKPIKIYELSWGRLEELTMTTTLGGQQASAVPPQSINLVLSIGDEEVTVNQACPVITLGRDAANCIVINDPKVSRQHARIELRKDQFILVDQSTNGTYVVRRDGQTATVRRYEILLPEKGVIGLGHQTPLDSPLAIQFRTEVRRDFHTP